MTLYCLTSDWTDPGPLEHFWLVVLLPKGEFTQFAWERDPCLLSGIGLSFVGSLAMISLVRLPYITIANFMINLDFIYLPDQRYHSVFPSTPTTQIR